MKEAKKYGITGVCGRFKPIHKGGQAMLESICEQSEHLVIGLGSCNKYNLRNPFTCDESKEMIDLTLKDNFDNYSFIQIPDFAHIPEYSDGQMWRTYVKEHFGELDIFFSGNDYVMGLLGDDYEIIEPYTIIPEERRVPIRGTMVRVEMAKGSGLWKLMVPDPAAEYLESEGLLARFRKEFGLQTLASVLNTNYCGHESAGEEYKHTLEG